MSYSCSPLNTGFCVGTPGGSSCRNYRESVIFEDSPKRMRTAASFGTEGYEVMSPIASANGSASTTPAQSPTLKDTDDAEQGQGLGMGAFAAVFNGGPFSNRSISSKMGDSSDESDDTTRGWARGLGA